MADGAVIAAAAAGLWYLLRGKKREAREELPEVTGPQPKAIPSIPAVAQPSTPLPPVVAAALAPASPPVTTFAPPTVPVRPAPILMPPVQALPVVTALPAPPRTQPMFHRQSFAPSRGQLMPSADASRIYPPVFPTFLK